MKAAVVPVFVVLTVLSGAPVIGIVVIVVVAVLMFLGRKS